MRTWAAGVVAVLSVAACAPASEQEPEPLPMEAFWAGLNVSHGIEDGFADLLEQQELVAACMAEQGFEYLPVDFSQGAIINDSADLEHPWGTREFAERYGYGLTTDPYGRADEPDPVWVDPNEAIVAAMSAAERAEYQLALSGDQTRFAGWTEEDWATHEWDWRDEGCYGRAQHELDRRSGAEEFAALFAELGTLEETIAADPGAVAALDAWSACMAEAGHPGLRTLDDARNLLKPEVDAAWNATVWAEGLSETERRARDPELDRRLTALAAEEIALATAEWDCREATGYDDVAREVRRGHEQEFLETHRAELDAYAEHVG